MNYEELLKESDELGLTVREKDLAYNDGRQKGRRIAIRKSLPTDAEKYCVLAEELGHYHTTVGDILDTASGSSRKQELCARAWAYNKTIGLAGIAAACEQGCHSSYDMAEFLGVTEPFLLDALNYYKHKYGLYAKRDNYTIFFEPSLCVFRSLDTM